MQFVHLRYKRDFSLGFFFIIFFKTLILSTTLAFFQATTYNYMVYFINIYIYIYIENQYTFKPYWR